MLLVFFQIVELVCNVFLDIVVAADGIHNGPDLILECLGPAQRTHGLDLNALNDALCVEHVATADAGKVFIQVLQTDGALGKVYFALEYLLERLCHYYC